MNPQLILVHHPEVEARWRGICHGRMEARLSAAGEGSIPRLVDELKAFAPAAVFTSPSIRAAAVSEPLASGLGLPVRLDQRLSERHYGEWEGKTWAEVQAADREGMRLMLDDPENYAPPGGETLFAMRDRILAWYRSLEAHDHVVAISHAGPISALLGTLEGLPHSDWQSRVPAMGDRVRLPLGQ